MEPERLIGYGFVVIKPANFTPSVSFAEEFFHREFSREQAVAGSFCLRVSSGFACSRFAPSALKIRESLPSEPLSCNSNSKVERGQSQGANVLLWKLFTCNLASALWFFRLFAGWFWKYRFNRFGESLRHRRSRWRN